MTQGGYCMSHENSRRIACRLCPLAGGVRSSRSARATPTPSHGPAEKTLTSRAYRKATRTPRSSRQRKNRGAKHSSAAGRSPRFAGRHKPQDVTRRTPPWLRAFTGHRAHWHEHGVVGESCCRGHRSSRQDPARSAGCRGLPAGRAAQRQGQGGNVPREAESLVQVRGRQAIAREQSCNIDNARGA